MKTVTKFKCPFLKFSVKNIASILVSIFATAFIVLGTVLVIYYANGYRINKELSDFERTGVLNVESNPLRATIILDGQVIGRTPKTISSLKEGSYELQLIRDQYIPWKSNIEIVGEKSTPVHPVLFLAEQQPETVFKIDSEISHLLKPKTTNYVFITTEKEITQNVAFPLQQTVQNAETDPRSYTSTLYKIWRYETNPSIWGNQQNPKLVLEMDITNAKDLELILSNNGESGLAIVTTQNNEVNNYTTYLLDTSIINNPKPVDIAGFVDDYEIKWSEDNNYLLLESDSEIVSFNINSNTKYLLKKKDSNLVWTTDTEGNFYYLNVVEPNSDGKNGHMQILRTALTGSEAEVIVDKIYYREDNKYLITQEDLLSRESLFTFTNSPSSSQFAGLINNFKILPNLDMIWINTDYAMYIYDINLDKYSLISVKPGELISVAPDLTKLLYRSDSNINLYVFEKEPADHTTKLGVSSLLSSYQGNETDIKWRADSSIIYYFKDEKLNYIDIKGENKNTLSSFEDQFFITDNSGDYIFGTQTDENGFKSLVRIRIH